MQGAGRPPGGGGSPAGEPAPGNRGAAEPPGLAPSSAPCARSIGPPPLSPGRYTCITYMQRERARKADPSVMLGASEYA